MSIRKADWTRDCQAIYDLVDDAYRIEIGNTGEGFCVTNRYEHIDVNSDEFRQILQHFYVYEESSVIVGCVKAVVDKGKVEIIIQKGDIKK